VESALGTAEALERCRNSKADMLLLGQSVPREEKRTIVEVFRRYSDAPILSLLNANQEKLAEVDYGIDSLSPEDLVRTVHSILYRK
jgi:ribosomal protein L30E